MKLDHYAETNDNEMIIMRGYNGGGKVNVLQYGKSSPFKAGSGEFNRSFKVPNSWTDIEILKYFSNFL